MSNYIVRLMAVCSSMMWMGLVTPAHADVTPGWYSLGAGNWSKNFDAKYALACAAIADRPDEVLCLSNQDSGQSGGAPAPLVFAVGTDFAGNKIPGGTVKSIALKAHMIQGTKVGYELFLLGSDNVVRHTYGVPGVDSNTFASVSNFIQPLDNTGATLCLKKIIHPSNLSTPIGLSCGGTLYKVVTVNNSLRWRKYYSSQPTPINDMGARTAGGATFLFDNSWVWYDTLSGSGNWLPSLSGYNITAVGGDFVLTDAGWGGTCTYTGGCQGDQDRIWRFMHQGQYWTRWNAPGLHPIASPQACPQENCTGPLVRDNIVDGQLFGKHLDRQQPDVFSSGPLVWRSGYRVYFHAY